VGVDGVEQIVAAVAAVHVTDHSVLPDKRFVGGFTRT
jgi:hypothetical protein